MKRACSWLLIAVLGLGLSACGPADTLAAIQQVASPVYPEAVDFDDTDAQRLLWEQSPVSESTGSAANDFSYASAAQLLSATQINSCYSPLSLYFALALAATGANGETKEEMLSLLGMFDDATLSEECRNLYRQLYTDNGLSKLRIANSLWMDNEIGGREVAFKESFTDNAVNSFYASLYSVDFADQSTGKAISQWVSDNTNGTLAADFQADPEQILSIINTVYFYDEWIDPFNADKTKPDTFHLPDNSSTTCDFMNMTMSSHGFSKGEGYTRSTLNLKSAGQMVFILPDEDIGTAHFLASANSLREAFEGGQSYYGEVVWSVPKFSYDSEYSLPDMLKALGMTTAFSPVADFSALTDGQAYLSDAIQKTHISVNEKGVEASAFTQLDYAGAAPPDGRAEMILNRPFIFGITAANGTLLFIGVCENPA